MSGQSVTPRVSNRAARAARRRALQASAVSASGVATEPSNTAAQSNVPCGDSTSLQQSSESPIAEGRAARPQDHLHREAWRGWWNLPQRRLHPFQQCASNLAAVPCWVWLIPYWSL